MQKIVFFLLPYCHLCTTVNHLLGCMSLKVNCKCCFEYQDTFAVFLQEGRTPHEENMQYLNLAVRAFQKVPSQSRRDRRPAKRDSSGQTLENVGPFTVPFGPHLCPVLCPQEPGGRERLTHARSRDCAGGSLENSAGDHSEPGARTITTNDLLDCLVHPDVVARVTELLLARHAQIHEEDKHPTTHTHTSVSE